VIDDESGARPLPTGSFADEVYVDPLDERVDLPGVSRERRGVYFGIGAGLGIIALAVAGALYLGGFVARTPLGPTPADAPLAAWGRPLDDMMREEALARARIAPVWIAETSVRPRSVQDSPDIHVIEQPPAGAAQNAPTTPTTNSSPAARSSDASGEELDAAVPGGAKPGTSSLTNELDELQRSLRPRGPLAPPKAPSNAQSAPEETDLPPPAEPTAPAENPY
jgi:hypothetical protein